MKKQNKQNKFEVGNFMEDLAELGQIRLRIMTSSYISIATDLTEHAQWLWWLPKQEENLYLKVILLRNLFFYAIVLVFEERKKLGQALKKEKSLFVV